MLKIHVSTTKADRKIGHSWNVFMFIHVIITKVKSKGCHICQLRKKLIKRLKQILHINYKYKL